MKENQGCARFLSAIILVGFPTFLGSLADRFIGINYVGSLGGFAIGCFVWWLIWKPSKYDPDEGTIPEHTPTKEELPDNWLYTKIMTWLNFVSEKLK